MTMGPLGYLPQEIILFSVETPQIAVNNGKRSGFWPWIDDGGEGLEGLLM